MENSSTVEVAEMTYKDGVLTITTTQGVFSTLGPTDEVQATFVPHIREGRSNPLIGLYEPDVITAFTITVSLVAGPDPDGFIYRFVTHEAAAEWQQ